MKLTLKITFFILAVFLCFGSALGGNKAYYSSVTVKAETGKGVVYASQSADEPADNLYKESSTMTINGSSNKSETVYLFAKPLAEGDVFKYWQDAGGNTILGNSVVVEGSEDQNNPNKYTYTAIFGSPSAVAVEVNDPALGSVTIDKLDNKVGDNVTITASLSEPWSGGMGTKKWSKSHVFEGWYNQSGELVSTDAKYTFEVETPDVLTARFKWTPFVTGAGYYRVRYSYNQQFWILTGAYDPTPSMFTTHESRKINGVLDLSRINDFSNPAAIMRLDANSFTNLEFYKEEQVVASGLSLESQGISTATVLKGKALKLQTCHNVGFYKILYSSYQIAASEHNYGDVNNPNLGYLYVNSDQTGKSGSDPDSYFEFEPVDLEHVDEFYFGAEPAEELYYDGAYWTTMFTSFPYQCYEDDGVEAYIVEVAKNVSGENYAILTKIENGIVPAYTAVILKCKGLTAKENRLIPLWDDVESLSSNILKGEFQLNQTKNDPQHVQFDDSRMRLFGLTPDGSVGFFNPNDTEAATYSTYSNPVDIEANRAYLEFPQEMPASYYKISTPDNIETGVEDVVVDDNVDENTIYDLYGRRVNEMVSGHIYIVNGKKILYR